MIYEVTVEVVAEVDAPSMREAKLAVETMVTNTRKIGFGACEVINFETKRVRKFPQGGAKGDALVHKYFHCGGCNKYHPTGFTEACCDEDGDSMGLTAREMDEEFGREGWLEVEED